KLPILSTKKMRVGSKVELRVSVQNTGTVDGEEVVQLYLKKLGDDDGPAKTLRAFRRVFIPAGESVEVSFKLGEEELRCWHEASGSMRMHPGAYSLMVGGSSREGDLQKVALVIK
ncbi:MAG: fibronectin type III-like domain-contianing protein, partial [Bacteroidia bacterium]